MTKENLTDHVVLCVAFLGALVVYGVLSWHGSNVGRLEDVVLVLAGAIAGVAIPKVRSAVGGQ